MPHNLEDIRDYLKIRNQISKADRVKLRTILKGNIKDLEDTFVAFVDKINNTN